jgi:hypothetical protein
MTSPTHSRLVWCWATALAVLACGGQTESSSQRSSGSGGAWSGGSGSSQGGSDGGVTSPGGSPAGGTASGGAPSGGASLGGTHTGGFSTGGFPSGGSPLGGTATGGYSLGGVATGGSPVGGYGPDAWDPWPTCTERGGTCVFMGLGEKCLAGSYNPFSDSTLCPTDSYSRCCVPTGGVGSPCDASSPCREGGCLPEASHYPPGGVCSFICATNNCPPWGVCVPVMWSQAPSSCLISCTESALCREGQSCQAFATSFNGGQTTYACWRPGSPTGKGLGDPCDTNSSCLSWLCRPDPAGTNRCSASCDDTHRCLSGFACVPDTACSTAGCGFCLPT